MEDNDPFMFGPDASTDMETLHAIYYANNDDNNNNNGAYNPNNLHDISTTSCYLDALTSTSDDAATDWSNLQLSLNGISSPTSSQSSVTHEGSMFQEAFLSSHHNPHVSNLTLAIQGMNNNAGIFDAIPASTSGSDELAMNNNLPYMDDKPSRMTKQSLRALKDWKAQHGDATKPTMQQIHRLQRRTNLSSEQILNWFSHTKRRADTFGYSHSQQLGTLSQDFSANATGAATMERPSTPAVRDIIYNTPNTPLGDMDPLERWENSPPEHEAASFSDIAKALTHSPLVSITTVPNKSQTSTRSASRADDSASTRSSINGYHRDPSTSSLDSDMPGSITWSDHSGTSAQSGRSESKPEYRRRARKRRTTAVAGLNINSLRSNNVPKTFQCTFCTDSFKTKYDWSRHEKSLHLALESWMCSPLEL